MHLHPFIAVLCGVSLGVVACGGTSSSGGSSGAGYGAGSSGAGSSSSGSEGASSGASATSSGSVGASSGSVGTSSGTVAASSGSGGNLNCSFSGGNYTVHFTLKAGSDATCPTIPDDTVMLTANEMPTPSNMMVDAGGCDVNESGCTYSESCTTSDMGDTTTFSVTLTAGNDTISGTETIKETIAVGTTTDSIMCTYGISYTKQ